MSSDDFLIVDPHVHLWDLDRMHYPWLDELPQINRNHLLEDYFEAVGSCRVEKMVFMQCDCLAQEYMKEVEWVTELAEKEEKIAGMVSFAPIDKGQQAKPELETLARNPLVKGVRRLLQAEPDPEFCLRPDFIEGLKLLPGLGLTFDICVINTQLASVVRMVKRCPEVRFVLDHIGKPDIKNGELELWKSTISDLAKNPNVFCKLSSVATTADWQNWTIEDLKPYVSHVLDSFGFDRTMFAGDWPVSTLAASFPQCVETILAIIEGCTLEEKRKLFRENAIRAYGL